MAPRPLALSHDQRLQDRSPRGLTRAACTAASLLVVLASIVAAEEPETAPPLPDGTAEATRAIAGFRTPPGTQVRLFAAEPQLGNPVAFCLDERGRVYVAEQYRFNRGTEENRTRPFLLEDDLQVRTLDDRLAMFRKHESKFEGGMRWFRRYTDQIRLLEDRDGDGRADRSTVFAAGFNDTLDGMAAGVLARDGDVYVTCVPHLWRLRDRDGDGRADERQAIHRGFGVNAAFLGHDLHGLAWGPDGKLYFSVGDRGFDVATREGERLSGPRVGAVFRCFPDGSQLEVVARGLRNPQEIAFDQYGELFAADNNCDKGDHSRLVWVVDGGDSGWNMAYQTIPAPYLTGPWHAEKMWHLADPEQPAWITPPVGKLGAGPSGFAYYPGTGLAPRYDDHFLMCNYTSPGGVEAFAVRQKGAGFETYDEHDFWKPIQATDVEFGYDGDVYVSDYVKLVWDGGGGWGRVYALRDPVHGATDSVRSMTEVFRTGFANRSNAQLAELLAHADLRVRQRAQFELARRGGGQGGAEARRALETAARSGERTTTRLHGLWGVAQIAASAPAESRGELLAVVRERLADGDFHVRAQAALRLGELRDRDAGPALVDRLGDENPRVAFYAALALSRVDPDGAAPRVVELLRTNADADPFLRHAGVMTLARCERTDVLERFGGDASPAVRLAVLLALRRRGDERLARFLDDAEPRLVLEAARAVHDLPLDGATAKLAGLAARLASAAELHSEALWRRVAAANERLGGAAGAETLATLAAHPRLATALRAQALDALRQWSEPPARDRVTGFWRPIPRRAPDAARAAVEKHVAALLAFAQEPLQSQVADLVGALAIPVDDAVFAGWLGDDSRSVGARIAALRILAARKSAASGPALETALAAQRRELRAEARELLATREPGRALELLRGVLDDERAARDERQRALAVLARLRTPPADAVLADWADRLAAGHAPAALRLDVADAVETRGDAALRGRLAEWTRAQQAAGALGPYRVALEGGDAARGRTLFHEHPVAQCVRCHRVAGAGGTAGPDLTQVARRGSREHVLESLVDPDAKIAPGFGAGSFVLQDGRVVTGIIRQDDGRKLVVETTAGEAVTIRAEDVEERTPARSPMPSPLKFLSRRDLRDLVEYLSTLQ